MRVGSVEYHSRPFRIHAHVIGLGSEEHCQLVWFRDTLRREPALMRSYEARKRAILALGIQDSLEYCKAKGAFIKEVLKRQQTASEHRAESTDAPVPSSTVAATCECAGGPVAGSGQGLTAPAMTERGQGHLAIQEGNTASQEFLHVHFGDLPKAERQRVRRHLEAYCGQDTLGMIGILEAVEPVHR